MNPLLYLESCTSTNDEILRLAEEEDHGLKAVYTFNQTQGRGQYGNRWESAKNLNIAFSFLINSGILKTSGFLFNYYTAAVFREFLANMTSHAVEIKWPNDLIIHRKKVAGILVEKKKISGKNYYVTGIGINVLQQDFRDFPKAGSLLTQTGLAFDLHTFAEKMHFFLVEKFSEKQVSENEILDLYNSFLFRKGEISTFEINGVRQNGIIQEADETGNLWIKMERDGLRKFFHKEIEMLY